MTELTRYAPAPGPLSLDELLAGLHDPGSTALEPFSEPILAFFGAFSQHLFALPEARRFPELQALAFFMRRAELVRLKQRFEARIPAGCLGVPRGLVFHAPPANVDTMFVYSWLLASLVGNRNVVRLSSRGQSPQVGILLAGLNDLLARPEHEALRGGTLMIGYGHDPEVTAALTAACDVRMLWGGDATIKALRAFPLAPSAKELAFPDRFSLAALDATGYLAASAAEQAQLAERFYNDVYWFDQLGCASPRLVVWCGPSARCELASQVFFRHLAQRVGEKGYAVAAGTALRKLLFTHGAVLDHPVVRHARYGEAIDVLTLANLSDVRGEHCGAGLFFEAWLDDLLALVPFVRRKDQTLAHAGFAPEELRALATALNGRGLDRLVPIGDALTFQPVWDGYDLLQELSRLVQVAVPAGQAARVSR